MKTSYRIISIIIIICLLASDIASAYPGEGRGMPSALAQKTIFTSDDKGSGVLAVVEKWLKEEMESRFRFAPLAAAEDTADIMLETLANIAREGHTNIKDKLEVVTSAGQVFIIIEDRHIIRFFDPTLQGLQMPDEISSRLPEFLSVTDPTELNSCLHYQILTLSGGKAKEEAPENADPEWLELGKKLKTFAALQATMADFSSSNKALRDRMNDLAIEHNLPLWFNASAEEMRRILKDLEEKRVQADNAIHSRLRKKDSNRLPNADEPAVPPYDPANEIDHRDNMKWSDKGSVHKKLDEAGPFILENIDPQEPGPAPGSLGPAIRNLGWINYSDTLHEPLLAGIFKTGIPLATYICLDQNIGTLGILLAAFGMIYILAHFLNGSDNPGGLGFRTAATVTVFSAGVSLALAWGFQPSPWLWTAAFILDIVFHHMENRHALLRNTIVQLSREDALSKTDNLKKEIDKLAPPEKEKVEELSREENVSSLIEFMADPDKNHEVKELIVASWVISASKGDNPHAAGILQLLSHKEIAEKFKWQAIRELSVIMLTKPDEHQDAEKMLKEIFTSRVAPDNLLMNAAKELFSNKTAPKDIKTASMTALVAIAMQKIIYRGEIMQFFVKRLKEDDADALRAYVVLTVLLHDSADIARIIDSKPAMSNQEIGLLEQLAVYPNGYDDLFSAFPVHEDRLLSFRKMAQEKLTDTALRQGNDHALRACAKLAGITLPDNHVPGNAEDRVNEYLSALFATLSLRVEKGENEVLSTIKDLHSRLSGNQLTVANEAILKALSSKRSEMGWQWYPSASIELRELYMLASGPARAVPEREELPKTPPLLEPLTAVAVLGFFGYPSLAATGIAVMLGLYCMTAFGNFNAPFWRRKSPYYNPYIQALTILREAPVPANNRPGGITLSTIFTKMKKGTGNKLLSSDNVKHRIDVLMILGLVHAVGREPGDRTEIKFMASDLTDEEANIVNGLLEELNLRPSQTELEVARDEILKALGKHLAERYKKKSAALDTPGSTPKGSALAGTVKELIKENPGCLMLEAFASSLGHFTLKGAYETVDELAKRYGLRKRSARRMELIRLEAFYNTMLHSKYLRGEHSNRADLTAINRERNKEFEKRRNEYIKQGMSRDAAVVKADKEAPSIKIGLVGDLHGQHGNLSMILSKIEAGYEKTVEERVRDGELILVFTGDIIHNEVQAWMPPDQRLRKLIYMDDSMTTLRMVMDLAIKYPDRVIVNIGNHDNLEGDKCYKYLDMSLAELLRSAQTRDLRNMSKKYPEFFWPVISLEAPGPKGEKKLSKEIAVEFLYINKPGFSEYLADNYPEYKIVDPQRIMVDQTDLFREYLKESFGQEYLNMYNQYIKSIPFETIADGIISSHAGPIRNLSLGQIDKAGRNSRELIDAMWLRPAPIKKYLPDTMDHSLYYEKDVKEHKENIGQPNAISIVSHSPTLIRNSDLFYEEVFAGHYVIDAARVPGIVIYDDRFKSLALVDCTPSFVQKPKRSLRSFFTKKPNGAAKPRVVEIDPDRDILEDYSIEKAKSAILWTMYFLRNENYRAEQSNRTVVLAINSDFGDKAVRDALTSVGKALSRKGQLKDNIRQALPNIVTRVGTAKELTTKLRSMSNVRKEDIIIITPEKDRAKYFSSYEGSSTITSLDDITDINGLYDPLTEAILFTLVRRSGIRKEEFLDFYRQIPNIAPLSDKGAALTDEEIWKRYGDRTSREYCRTLVLRLINQKDPVKPIMRKFDTYKEIADYFESEA